MTVWLIKVQRGVSIVDLSIEELVGIVTAILR